MYTNTYSAYYTKQTNIPFSAHQTALSEYIQMVLPFVMGYGTL